MLLSQDEAVALAAGASTGIIADLILFPLDFLKTHAQGNNIPPIPPAAAPAGLAAAASAAAPAAATVTSAAAGSPPTSSSRSGAHLASGRPPAASNAAAVTSREQIGSRSGVRCRGRRRALSSCYGGIAALAMGSMPSSAGFFVVYEMAKEKLKRLNTDAPLASMHIAAAAVAESSACVIRNPFEVVKQQVQLGLHASTAEGFSAVWRLEGMRGFFVGLGTSMLRDVPFAAMQLSLWEWFKLKALGENPPSTSVTTVVSGASGMVAGAVAAVVTTPMDVVKTRLMTQTPGTREVSSSTQELHATVQAEEAFTGVAMKGFFHCLSTMLRREGFRSLFLGVQMRCLWVALGGGIFLGGYDAFSGYYRHLFKRNNLFEPQCCTNCCQPAE